MSATGRFRIRYGALRFLLSVLGLGPMWSGVDVDRDTVRVRMGWAFRGRIPRSSITSAHTEEKRFWGGIGVHGFGGRWLVNGSTKGIVTVEVEPRCRAWMCGIPVRLRTLHVSVDDPDGLVAAITGG